MSGAGRKIKRKQELLQRKQAKKEIGAKVAAFGDLPNECLVCEKGFDKKSKEMTTKWYVIQDKENIRLYCPDCWKMAADVIEQYAEDKN
jgi:ribosomal protein L44E